MLVSVLLVVVGVVALTIAADHFVEGAASIAAVLRVSPVVVGALVIGFGTSLPEMLVSGVAALEGNADLGVGNVIGSNVANLTLVLGLAALICAVGARTSAIRRELPLCIGSVVLFAVLVQDGLRIHEGVILAVALVAALGVILLAARDEVAEIGANIDEEPTLARSAVRTLFGLVGTVAGAWMLVEGAIDMADELGLTGGFVGLTMVAIGTSLPEMVTAVVAARKGETELIIGNLLGSNIFNSLAVGAVLGLLGPGPLEDEKLAGLATIAMVAVVVIAAAFLLSSGKIVRWQAVVLLVIYFATMPFTVSTEPDCAPGPDAEGCIEAVASAGG